MIYLASPKCEQMMNFPGIAQVPHHLMCLPAARFHIENRWIQPAKRNQTRKQIYIVATKITPEEFEMSLLCHLACAFGRTNLGIALALGFAFATALVQILRASAHGTPVRHAAAAAWNAILFLADFT